MSERMYLQRHKDDQYVDAVRIDTVPRYKQSDLSGDEWRVSGVIVLSRKGHVVYERAFSCVESAVKALPYVLMTFSEGADFKPLSDEVERSLCQQPGCAAKAEVTYRLKGYQIARDRSYRAVYSPEDLHEGVVLANSYERQNPGHIWFCARHAKRGDAGLQDADDNYTRVDKALAGARAVLKRLGK